MVRKVHARLEVMSSIHMQGRKVIFLVVSEASFEVRNNILAKIKANLDIHGAARIDRVKQKSEYTILN